MCSGDYSKPKGKQDLARSVLADGAQVSNVGWCRFGLPSWAAAVAAIALTLKREKHASSLMQVSVGGKSASGWPLSVECRKE